METTKVHMIHDYNDKLDKDESIFLAETQEINEVFASRICDDIREQIYMLKGVNIPQNDLRLNKKVTDEIDSVINEYGYVIHANKINQEKELSNLFQDMPIEQMDNIQFSDISVLNETEAIRRKITDRIITYFNFENQSNSMYWEKSKQVEEIVRKRVNKDDIQTVINNIDNIYLEIMQQMKEQNKTFIEEFSYKKGNNISDDGNSVLTTEGIFDEVKTR